MKELSLYASNLKVKYGPLKTYAARTQFDPSVHFELDGIFGSGVESVKSGTFFIVNFFLENNL